MNIIIFITGRKPMAIRFATTCPAILSRALGNWREAYQFYMTMMGGQPVAV